MKNKIKQKKKNQDTKVIGKYEWTLRNVHIGKIQPGENLDNYSKNFKSKNQQEKKTMSLSRISKKFKKIPKTLLI